MVGRPSEKGRTSMFCAAHRDVKAAPAESAGSKRANSTGVPPSEAILAAVLAAPPSTRRVLSGSTRRMGTGASGDRREQSPVTYSSTMLSPSTRMRAPVKAESASRKSMGSQFYQKRGARSHSFPDFPGPGAIAREGGPHRGAGYRTGMP